MADGHLGAANAHTEAANANNNAATAHNNAAAAHIAMQGQWQVAAREVRRLGRAPQNALDNFRQETVHRLERLEESGGLYDQRVRELETQVRRLQVE